jgi:phospholipid transport system substrate-binding protein
MRLARSKRTLKGGKRIRNDFQEVVMKKQLVGFWLIMGLMFPQGVYSGVPLEMVKGQITRVLEVLRNPALKGESGRKAKREEVRSISEEMFDFTELSRRSLGQNWNNFGPDQQKELIKLYKSLLKDVYADKITSYTDEKVIFKREITLSEKTVEVETTIVTKTSEVPINYRVIEKEGQWKVYDVVIEGVSLVSNYRAQFREILANQTPEALLETLRKKVGKGQTD